jgi:SNF2 family DNA or RNA helicase
MVHKYTILPQQFLIIIRVISLIIVEKYLDLFPVPKHNRKVIAFHEGLSLKQRKRLLNEILSNNSAYIFLTPFQVKGVGLNLQKFNMIIFLDRSWNPQVNLILYIYIYLYKYSYYYS